MNLKTTSLAEYLSYMRASKVPSLRVTAFAEAVYDYLGSLYHIVGYAPSHVNRLYLQHAYCRKKEAPPNTIHYVSPVIVLFKGQILRAL